MKLVYTHENKVLVENARNMLSLKNIETVLKNEFASGAAGDLVPAETWPELWVLDEAHYDEAASILQVLTEKISGPDWICSHCQEPNGAAFESCWNCQTERAAD
ncbi:DUF2007 domain-containing protein [Leucothrix mucor]|uniref:putative signal transducing protein n=1 Tax=Leucothrix mucor TaxID=45248 RepID=UPI0003B44E88|nr:DUF2007 domain-containing protein [Leucothrix mucor]